MRVPSYLITHFSKLSLTELKIFFLSLCNKHNEAEKIDIPFKSILKTHRPGGSQYGQIAGATEKLMKRVLICFNDEKLFPGIKRKYIHYLQYAEHDTAILSVKQSKEILNLLNTCHNVGGYVKINLRSILKIRSWYSARLYLLLCQRLKAGYLSIEYDNLKTILQCSNIYDRQQNFINRCVVEPLKELNATTELNIKMDLERKGHRVRKFYFTIAARADRGDIREILEESTAERIEKNYPSEFIKYCLLLTKKIHKPEKGTASGLFLKILHNNFNKWKIELDKNRKFLNNKNKSVLTNTINEIMTPEKYAALPDQIRGVMDRAGGVKTWTHQKRINKK
jgi:plasmid replication initiation protein